MFAAGLSGTVMVMNHYEINKIAGLLNDALNKTPETSRLHPRAPVRRPGGVRRRRMRRGPA